MPVGDVECATLVAARHDGHKWDFVTESGNHLVWVTSNPLRVFSYQIAVNVYNLDLKHSSILFKENRKRVSSMTFLSDPVHHLKDLPVNQEVDDF